VSIHEWNQRYRTREEIDHEPAQLLVDAVRDLTPGRALDLACGAGRNAVWLAQHGWDVVALDGAEEAIGLIHEPRVEARVFDLEAGAPLPFEDESFDLVLILYYLHPPLFAEAKRVLRRGGTIVVAVLTKGRYGIGRGELVQHFEGFDVLHHREEEVAEMVAKKVTEGPPAAGAAGPGPR
jgi:tellurite methyltransferase